MKGRLYGIGLGPGDPELLTLKAARLIRNAKVVAYLAPAGDCSFARGIAADFIAEDALEIPIEIPMQPKRYPAQQIFDLAAEELRTHLLDGTDIVMLCQGDPFFYGSFMYMFVRLAKTFECEVVPGVTSLTAVAAAAAQPICARTEAVSILPAQLGEKELEMRIAGSSAAVIVKIGKHMPMVKRLLCKLGHANRATFVSHASLPQQRVMPLEDAPDNAPYFSTILVPGRDPYGAR